MLIVKDSALIWQRGLFGYGLSIAFWMPLAALLAWQQYRIAQEEHLKVSLASLLVLGGVRFFTIALAYASDFLDCGEGAHQCR